ncbi:MAG: hypothetical protein ABJM29_21710 [Rhizobiaceae bacterium]
MGDKGTAPAAASIIINNVREDSVLLAMEAYETQPQIKPLVLANIEQRPTLDIRSIDTLVVTAACARVVRHLFGRLVSRPFSCVAFCSR